MLERVGIYGPHGSPLVAAVSTGLRRLDKEPIELAPNVWTAQNTRTDLDGVVLVGVGLKLQELARFWGPRVPTARCLPPYLPEPGRDPQAFVGCADPSWLPPRPASAKRFAASGAKIEERRRVKAQAVLLCGRGPGFGVTRSQAELRASETLARLRSLTDSRIIWRPDPLEPFPLTGADETSWPREGGVAEVFDRTWLVVTDGAALGLDALLAGLPVLYAGDEPTIYSPLCEPLQRFGQAKAPPRQMVERFARGILAAQHTYPEIATGAPLAAALNPSARLSLALEGSGDDSEVDIPPALQPEEELADAVRG